MSKYKKTSERFECYLAWLDRLESDGWPKDCRRTYKVALMMKDFGNWPHDGYEGHLKNGYETYLKKEWGKFPTFKE